MLAEEVLVKWIMTKNPKTYSGRNHNPKIETIGEITFESDFGTGCDTCGYGESGKTIEFYANCLECDGRHSWEVKQPYSLSQIIKEMVALDS